MPKIGALLGGWAWTGRLGHALIVTVLLLGCTPVRAQGQQPNIILLLTDDQTLEELQHMPHTQALLVAQGLSFSHAFVNYPSCCPSRVSILRGQYAHNHRVLGTKPPLGGFPVFRDAGLETSTVATWLQDAGYYTALVGKYLNSYPGTRPDAAHASPPEYLPPGWNAWYASLYNLDYVDYALNENGTVRHYGASAEDYLSDVQSHQALEVLATSAARQQPFFLYLASFAPHTPAVPAERHAHLFPDAVVPRDPAFLEADVSDKPAAIRDQPPLTAAEIATVDALYRKRLQTLQALDETLLALVNRLEQDGRLANTYLIFSSDNGFHLGHHRIRAEQATASDDEEGASTRSQLYGKGMMYEHDVRVPLVIRGPGVPSGSVRNELVLNTDLAPTIAALAGVPVPSFVDGKSLLPLWQGNPPPWRQAVLLQSWMYDRDNSLAQTKRTAVRTTRYKYVEWLEGDRELYDLQTDPYELQNLYAFAEPALIASLQAQLRSLEACRANTCP